MLKHILALLAFLCATTISYSAHAALDRSQLSKQQKDFLLAHKAIKINDRIQIAKYKKKLAGYPLSPYVQYLDIVKNMASMPEQNIAQFIKKYQSTHLAERARGKWLLHLGKKKKWKTFNQFFDAEKDTSSSLKCLSIEAQIKQKKNQNAVIKQAQKLWTTGKPLSRSCKPLDKYLRKNKKITGAMVWNNIIKAMNNRQLSFAKRLSQDLSQKDRKIYQVWRQLDRKPATLSQGLPKTMPLRIKQAALSLTLKRLAKKDGAKALKLLNKFGATYQLENTEITELKQYISLRLAYRAKDEAKTALDEVNRTQASKDTLRWQLQLALKASDWPTILDTYKLLDEEQKKQDKWQYWHARALGETGNAKKAKPLFEQLSKKRNFYGFLSADRLKTKYHFNPKAAKEVDTEFLIKKYTQLPRIKELLAINWTLNANREWYHLLNNVHPNDLNAISFLALDWQQHNIAIRGAAKAKDWNNILLRFPTPHKQPVMKSADDHKIDPAWIYGVMRRESAFSKDIRSSVGATGLMQLMPATAKFIGKKIGESSRTYRNLTNANSNIKLGSAYLSYLYKKYDNHRIMATAAYNAGPRRVDAWTPKKAIAADQWVDAIPFTETRKYVKAVMEYTIIFQSLLNSRYERLSSYMQPIGKEKPLIKQTKANLSKQSTPTKS